MSGRTVSLEATETWNILEVKQALAGLDVAPANQIRLLNGCNEMEDSDLIGACGARQFSLIQRSQQCAEWLDRLSQGGGCKLQEASEEIRSSKECVIAAVRISGFVALQSVPAFNDDMDVVMAAVLTDGLSLFVASRRLRADPTVALTAISRNREAIVAAFEPLRSDPDFLRRAYWASSLDCRSDTRLDGKDLGSLENWENVLYQKRGNVYRTCWSFVHQQLRDSNFAKEFTSPMCSMFTLLGLPRLVKEFHHSWFWLFLVYTAIYVLAWFGFDDVLNNMHVEFAACMAGRLVKPRRSSYKYCE